MVHYAEKTPGRFSFDGGRTIIPEKEEGTVECPSANHGDWKFDKENKRVLYASKYGILQSFSKLMFWMLRARILVSEDSFLIVLHQKMQILEPLRFRLSVFYLLIVDIRVENSENLNKISNRVCEFTFR